LSAKITGKIRAEFNNHRENKILYNFVCALGFLRYLLRPERFKTGRADSRSAGRYHMGSGKLVWKQASFKDCPAAVPPFHFRKEI
jgi:hypothetical protein